MVLVLFAFYPEKEEILYNLEIGPLSVAKCNATKL